mmetsp:Transcript_3487/g.7265  ORF Transcript_3487/g.7265 Transcript_3487/m.7265 type:complete len:211 (+) Transcript_3487:219-851(+)
MQLSEMRAPQCACGDAPRPIRKTALQVIPRRKIQAPLVGCILQPLSSGLYRVPPLHGQLVFLFLQFLLLRQGCLDLRRRLALLSGTTRAAPHAALPYCQVPPVMRYHLLRQPYRTPECALDPLVRRVRPVYEFDPLPRHIHVNVLEPLVYVALEEDGGVLLVRVHELDRVSLRRGAPAVLVRVICALRLSLVIFFTFDIFVAIVVIIGVG